MISKPKTYYSLKYRMGNPSYTSVRITNKQRSFHTLSVGYVKDGMKNYSNGKLEYQEHTSKNLFTSILTLMSTGHG